jgi:hypothetical protein
MLWLPLFVTVTLLLVTPATAVGRPEGRPLRGTTTTALPLRTHVVVRAYDAASMDDVALSAALVVAGDTLRDAGIDVSWMHCPVGIATGPCAQPIAIDELAVRIARLETPHEHAGQLPLGYSLVDPTRRAGTLATLYLDRVRWLAQVAHADEATLLGLAIAHELGHLLLGVTDHSTSGLMRPVWKHEEVRRGRPRDWSFTSRDGAAMRAAFTARSALAARSAPRDGTGPDRYAGVAVTGIAAER